MNKIKGLFQKKHLNQEIIDDFKQNKYITIHPTRKCNLGCSYCVNHKTQKMKAPETVLEKAGASKIIQQLESLLQGIDNLTVDFIGEGECLISPIFPELFHWCMDKKYKIIIQTNLHGTCMDVLRMVSALYSKEELQRVTVGTSFHLGAYRDIFRSDEKFNHIKSNWISNYSYLSKLGVQLGRIEMPMTPFCLIYDQLNCIFGFCKSLGGHPAPVALVGNYKGKHYPDGYTQEENKKLREFFNTWREDDEKIAIRVKKWNSEQIPHIEHQIYLQGNPCYKRMHSIEIMANGQIRYCQSFPYWWYGGHLLNGPFPNPVFEDKPVDCPIPACGCDTIGIRHCLRPNGIDIEQYYHAYYMDKNKPKIAEKFKNE